MFIPIIIDTESLVSQFTLDKEQTENLMDNVIKGITQSYAARAVEEAQDQLHSTRQRYINNIDVIDTGRLTGRVMLDYSKDKLIQMIEEGAASFDMKPFFMNSTKVKYTKKGERYMSIPFRLGAPDTIGDSGVFSGNLPQEVYDIVSKKETTIPVSGGGMRSVGLKVGEIPEQFQAVQTKKLENGGEYTHKSPISAGVFKQTDGVTGQSSYHSFRRVSENSDPNSWIHPGIEKHEIMTKALDKFNIEFELSRQLDIQLSRMGF